MGGAERTRLVGWKAIGAFIGRDARTAKRWETERGLPVYRTPGSARPTVWSDPDELQRWMAGGRGAALTDLRRPSRRGLIAIGVTGVVLAVAGTAAVVATRHRPRQSPDAYADDPAARDLYLAARYAWTTRTPQGLATALADFQSLTRKHPDRAPGWAGVADSYLLLREFGAMPAEQGFGLARVAANRALALDPDSAPATRALAFLTFYWLDDVPRALALFQRAADLDPNDAQTHHWYANALAARGRFAEALVQIGTARRLDPGSTAIVADQGEMLFAAGRRAEARRMMEDLVAVAPQFSEAHRYLAEFAAVEDRDADFLRETAAVARLRSDAGMTRLVAELEPVLAADGPMAMRRRYAEGLVKLYDAGAANAYVIAQAWSLARDRDEALRWLAICRSRGAAYLVVARSDVVLAYGLKGDPRFEALLRDV